MENYLNLINNTFLTIVIIMVLCSVAIWVNKTYLATPQKAIKNTHKKSSKQQTSTEKKDIFNISDKAYYIILAVIAVIAIAIRVWKFGSVPDGFNQDGALAAVDGKALADYGTDHFGTRLPSHLYAWGYAQMSSLLSYMIAIFVKIFGLSTITARLPLLIASLAGGTFFFLFVKDIFGKGVGLIAAIFVAINPWHFLQSRWALEANLLPHFFMAGLYFLNKGLTKNKIHTYISMIFFALCMYCYGISIYTIPAFLLATCIYYLVKKRLTWKDALISLAVYLAIAWPFILTMAVNYFKWDTISLPFVTIQYFPDSTRSTDILLFSPEPLKQLASNFKYLLNTTILQKKDLPWSDIAGFGTMFLCSIPFMITGCIELFRTKTTGAKGLVTLALLTGVWSGLLTNNVNVNRMNIIYYAMMIFISLGIYFVIKELKYLLYANVAVYLVLGVMLVSTYFGSYADSIKGYFYYGFGDALETAKNSGAEKLYITADAQGKGYKHTSEALTLFYDATDAKYFQGKTNENNGEKLLPYKERFTYESISEKTVAKTKDENVAYVIMNTDKNYFDENSYDIKTYGNFCSVTKK